MARNQMNDLRDHLFAALERLNDDELSPEQLSSEVEKAQAISNLSNAVIGSAKAEIDFMKATGMIGTTSNLFKGVNDPKRIE
jgi:flagellar hook-basal body complex protein FliE